MCIDSHEPSLLEPATGIKIHLLAHISEPACYPSGLEFRIWEWTMFLDILVCIIWPINI